MENQDNVEGLSAFSEELDKIEESVENVAALVAEKIRAVAVIAHHAEWHVKGLAYHLRGLVGHYQEFASEVSMRAAATGASMLIMQAPMFRKVMFEFYALVNLARISLDNLRLFLAPVFVTRPGNLPKSISDYPKGSTDCPVYERLSRERLVTSLCDIRNCIVHYRTFATSDGAVVVEEGFKEPRVASEWTSAMARATFRRVEDGRITVNILFPDAIFVRGQSGDKKLAEFTYDHKYNLLTQSRSFVVLVAGAILESLSLLADLGKPTYSFHKPKKAK